MKKGISPTVWLVIAVVVALVVALAAMMILNGSTTKFGGGTTTALTENQDGMEALSCQEKCRVCQSVYTPCAPATWDAQYSECSQPIPPNAAILPNCV